MDYLASNLKVWLSGHVVNKAAKVIDDYKNKSEISEALKEFKDAPRGVSQRYYEERIRELSNDSYLTKYEGNVSKANSGYGSDADRPSDAIIIMDLFGKYMGTKVHYSFSDTYIVTSYQAPSVLKSSNTGIYICLTRQSPTHYDIISYGKVHTILPGPNNVFYAIILFFYYVLSKNNGYLMDGNSIKQITSEIKMDEVIYKKRAQSNKY